VSRERYEVIIVGSGPAGIFAALQLSERAGRRVLMLDKGPDIDERNCPASEAGICVQCSPCAMVSGWGGAGAYSDGKLTLSDSVGGNLGDILPAGELSSLIEEVDATFVRFGAEGPVYGDRTGEIERLRRRAALAHLQLVPMRVRHVGTERCVDILKAMRRELTGKVDIRLETPVRRIVVEGSKVQGVEAEGALIRAEQVIVCPGREGAAWLEGEAHRLGLSTRRNPVDVGVRVELPAVVLEEVTDLVYEPKLIYYSKAFDDRVRTFCMCPYGQVVTENADGVVTVNGHSYAHRSTENTNFAVLVSKTFTEPFKDPIGYGRHIAELANLLGDGVLVQRLGDLEMGRRSTPERLAKSAVRPTLQGATPGDLGLVFPYRHLVNILEMLEAMNQFAPGVYARDTLLYGAEVKFYSSRVKVTGALETGVKGLFVAGDGAGLTRGLVQASASGIVAAREILSRL